MDSYHEYDATHRCPKCGRSDCFPALREFRVQTSSRMYDFQRRSVYLGSKCDHDLYGALPTDGRFVERLG